MILEVDTICQEMKIVLSLMITNKAMKGKNYYILGGIPYFMIKSFI